MPNWKYKDFVDNQFVISGSPATVRDSLRKRSRICASAI